MPPTVSRAHSDARALQTRSCGLLSFFPLVLLTALGCEHHPTERATPAGPSTTTVDPAIGSPLDAAPAMALDASVIAVAAAAATPITIENIGMHIGGGPNDAATKAPIAGSVAPHFGELRACFSQVGDPSRGGDFGIDLLIPAEGGRADVSHPRTNLRPDAFRDCVVAVFAAIDFARPRTGRTTVSYSLRFTPEVGH